MRKGAFKFLFGILLASVISSCAPTRNAIYLRSYKEVGEINDPDRVYHTNNIYSEKISSGDKLFITVTSGNSEPNAFNQASGQPVSDIELLSYEVDNEGNIKLPYLNKIKISGYSLGQASDTLQSRLSEYIYLPAVTIHFATSRITVIGEVNSPGVYEFNRKSINIFQAIAYANDITTFGNRKSVNIIRREGESIKKKKVDLTNDQILTSTWYNILPNDIVYVEPLRRRVFGMETFDYGLVFSALSTFLLLFSFFNPINPN